VLRSRRARGGRGRRILARGNERDAGGDDEQPPG
jgi:hypothetical protein